ncbi:MAG: hypothetical protein N3I86_00370 [Verrucomicrobiae bacterium]|nr:hypothetical protein [Verrucomicrobiae bacterium]
MKNPGTRNCSGRPAHRLPTLGWFWLSFCLLSSAGRAGENVPHRPFAEWAQLPPRGVLEVGAHYQESEAYYFWTADRRYKADFKKGGEHYGIDVNQGYVALQYGITERWAADLAVGVTTAGWRFFANDGNLNGGSRSTTGLMDVAFGVRYQLCREETAPGSCWKPDLAFRAGAVLPGSYDEKFPFAPGVGSAAIEPELLARKHFGWQGLGAYFDGLFRWNKTSANDQYIVALGLFQQIKGWELHAGWRHLGSISGDSIAFDPATRVVDYPRAVRENSDAVEAGFSYTFPRRHIRLEFYSRTVFDGSNTDKKFWVGGGVTVPLTLAKSH